MKDLTKLATYRDRYEIVIYLSPKEPNTSVYISKDDVELFDSGGENAITEALNYLNRINQITE